MHLECITSYKFEFYEYLCEQVFEVDLMHNLVTSFVLFQLIPVYYYLQLINSNYLQLN